LLALTLGRIAVLVDVLIDLLILERVDVVLLLFPLARVLLLLWLRLLFLLLLLLVRPLTALLTCHVSLHWLSVLPLELPAKTPLQTAFHAFARPAATQVGQAEQLRMYLLPADLICPAPDISKSLLFGTRHF
jgi:hypothetical protein